MRRKTAAATTSIALMALLLAAAPAGAAPAANASASMTASGPLGTASGPTATASNHEFTIFRKGKLKVRKKLKIRVGCAVDCDITANVTLKIGRRNIHISIPPGQLFAGQTATLVLRPNRAARRAIRRKPRAAKLRTQFSARDRLTGAVDVDKRTYRFKR